MGSGEYIDLFQIANCLEIDAGGFFFPEFNPRQKQFVLHCFTCSVALKVFDKHLGCCLLLKSTVCFPYQVCVRSLERSSR
jgi:hypothetical protein